MVLNVHFFYETIYFPSLLVHTALSSHVTSAEILFILYCTATGFTRSAFINRQSASPRVIRAAAGIRQQIILHLIPPPLAPAQHMLGYHTSHIHILALLSSPTEGQLPTLSKGDGAVTGRQVQGGTTHRVRRWQLRQVEFTTSLIQFFLCFLSGPWISLPSSISYTFSK